MEPLKQRVQTQTSTVAFASHSAEPMNGNYAEHCAVLGVEEKRGNHVSGIRAGNGGL